MINKIYVKAIFTYLFLIAVNRGRGVRAYGNNSISDVGDDVNGASGAEEDASDKTPLGVLIIPFGHGIGETVGMLSEQKVCI